MDRASESIRDLVAAHLPLVRTIAKRYAGSGEPLEDLVQVGSVGLVAAARRFDPARGVPFAAYATPTVDGELRRHLRDRVATIRVPRRDQERAASLRRAARAVAQRLGREASLAETAEAAGVDVDEARAALAGTAPMAPLSAVEAYASREAEDEFAACEDRAFVDDLIDALEPRQRQIVRLRFAGDLPQAEIARRLNMSQSQASRELTSALDALRRSMLADEAA
jgi:RNA polymerase sigma-B factor